MRQVDLTVKTLSTPYGEYRDVLWSGYTTNVPGLVITRPIVKQHGQFTMSKRGWTITHQESGWVLRDGLWFDTRKQAAACVSDLAPLTDWTQNAQTVANTPGLYNRVNEILAAHKAKKR